MVGEKVDPMKLHKYVLAATVLLLVAAIASALYFSVQVGNIGTITTIGVEVYSDPAGTLKLVSINWGKLNQGSINTKDLYIKNTGNSPGILTFTTNSWHAYLINGTSVPVDAVFTTSWDYSGTPVPAGSLVHVVFTLTLAVNTLNIDHFDYNTVIILTG